MTDEYLSISAPAGGLYKDKGRKFIAYAFPVTNEDEIRQCLAAIRKEHYAARHWCYAWRLGAEGRQYRANDDGEPSGTAGRPILNQILAARLSDVLVVVVRYFGGTLLGTGGLIHAYREAASAALGRATPVTRYVTRHFCIAFEPARTNEVMRRLKEFDAKIISHGFEQQNEIIFAMRLSNNEKLKASIKANNIPCQLREL
jgi:uncharacterized YigZ family protein